MLNTIKNLCDKFACSSLKKKAIAGFLLITVLAVLNIVIVQSLLRQSEDVAVVVNVAGKMRMLSQQTGMQFFATRRAPDVSSLEASSIEEAFENAYKTLIHGGTTFGLKVNPVKLHQQEHLFNIHESWVDYVYLLNRFRAQEKQLEGQTRLNRADIKEILNSADVLINNIEVLISDLLVSYDQIYKKVIYTAYGLFIFDLLFLLLIYRVFISRVIKPIEILSDQSSNITKGNYGVRTNFKKNDEFARLGEALNSSADHIEFLLKDLDKRQKRLNRANRIFDGVADNTVAGIYMLDENLNFTYVNDQIAKILGCDKSTLMNNFGIDKLFSPDDLLVVKDQINQRATGAVNRSHYETKAIRFDGSYVDIEIFGSIINVGDDVLIVGLALDISERKAYEVSLRRAALIYQNSSEGMVVTDENGIVIDVNSAFENITGYSADEILGNRLSKISSGEHDKDFYKKMWHSIWTTGVWSGDIRNRRKSGQEFVEHLKVNTIYNEDGSVHSRIGLFSDVTEKRRKEANVWHQANYDNLTKLPNRMMFNHSLNQEIMLARRNNSTFAVLFLDLDYFKDVNDTYGHEEGDELLKIMANRLQAAVRKSDLVARLGGDEFTLILKNIKSTSAIGSIVSKILNSVAQPYRLRSNTVTISASIGVAFYPHDGDSAESLLRNSDLAMYAAKELGRNQFYVFQTDLLDQSNSRKQLIQDLHLAVIEKQFELYYQPIIDFETGQIARVEALLRWHHPVRGLLMPRDFIAMAEETGQINAIGDWVFESVVNQIIEWQQQLNKDIKVSFNVSPVQFYKYNLEPERWLNYIDDRGVSATQLAIEITEHLYLDTENSELALEKLEVFNKAGVLIVLDDFGTGYSSLSYLNRFTTNFLKIDRSYIKHLTARDENYRLCQAIIAMAHELNIKTIAEGITNQEQHDLLKQVNCDFGQGYFYSKPVPVDKISEMFNES